LLTYRLHVWRLREQFAAEDERFWWKALHFNRNTPLHHDPEPERRHRIVVLLHELSRLAARVGARVLVINIDPRVMVPYLVVEPGLDVVDLASELDARGKTRPLTFTYDQHFNADTHRFLGEWIAREIRTRLPPPAR